MICRGGNLKTSIVNIMPDIEPKMQDGRKKLQSRLKPELRVPTILACRVDHKEESVLVKLLFQSSLFRIQLPANSLTASLT
ncbi:hypothetical protein VI01_23670 [Pantoea sp. SM3]|nr:hypothetical protein VI01_23670 [Pantoea sp. SM3]